MAPHIKISKPVVVLGAILLLHVATGCQQPGANALQPVRIATTYADANSAVSLDAKDPCKYADAMTFADAETKEGKTKPYAELLLMPGDLLPLKVKVAQSEDALRFWYVFRSDDSQPLMFSADGPVAMLSGRPIYLDLSRPQAADWLASRQPGDLSTLRGVRLGNDMEVNRTALKRLEHSGVLIECPKTFTFARDEDRLLADAILAADPAGLILKDATGLDRYLPRLKNITHLIMGWAVERPLPSLKEAGRLQVLYLDLTAAHPSTEPAATRPEVTADLRPLGLDQLPHLHTLFLYGEGCRNIKDLRALDKLHGLRHLTLADCLYLHNLSSLPHLYDLTGLEVIGDDDKNPMVGLEHLVRFQKLVKLALFCNLSKGPDLKPLASLKRLKILVLPKDILERKKTEVDDLRKALPDCRIYGMCMGSRWILAILVAGAAFGAALRRRRRNRLAIA